jgi:hypothetical protein
MNVYTDPSLLDVAGALEALPELSLDGAVQPDAGLPFPWGPAANGSRPHIP